MGIRQLTWPARELAEHRAPKPARGWSSPTPDRAPSSAPCSARARGLTILAAVVLIEDPGALANSLAGGDDVLYAPPRSAENFAAEPGYEIFNAARKLTAAVVAAEAKPRLFILTRNAQP
ncbi:hypothetical protein H7I76_33425, partial [Mycolicibacterium vaccae]|nr:hypothetical protein [Mycolicibacterium vaccae]